MPLRSTILLLTAAAIIAACSQKSGTDPQDFTLSGNWWQSGHLTDAVNGVSHVHEGYFYLNQAGAEFAGSGQNFGLCHNASGDYEGPLADSTAYPVSEGAVDGQQISFKTNLCTYSGSFENGNPNRITGTATCGYVENGVTYVFAGGWQANRE
jgi:hypothetical protein